MAGSDVAIVGAGPAGSAAAIHLATRGVHVVLIDRATFPRDKCCGDGLTTLALRELEALGFDPGVVADWTVVGEAWLRSPSGREVVLPLPRAAGVYAAVAPRLQLDAALVELAAKAGATVRLGNGFAGFESAATPAADRDGVTIRLADGTSLRTRHVVAADGMWSPVRKALGDNSLDSGLAGYRGEWHAFRQYAAGVTGAAAEHLMVWFEPDLLPGYAWSFPLGEGRANVGFGVLRANARKGAELRALWREVLDRAHVRGALGPGATLDDRVLTWPIPARVTGAPLAHGPVLFAGDAAAGSDVLTGEGIGQALLMGRLAAEAIAAEVDGGDGETATARYRRDVRHHLFADHRLSAALGRVLAHRRGANGALAIVANSGTWGRRTFARWMFEDEPRAVLATPRRWHRRFLRRPGAYAR